ncbi:efflux RND transporter periplasmic adaptor subunit [Hymenobacter humi]|uniref:Efflux RND transporter periplasmic adaptor subunit n=1 Tax=Hymenobacter humi TaxID=1411620 RepID=A0ABW2UAZ0_9BACT
MHPQVHQSKPGLCPICGMDLVKQAGHPTPAGSEATSGADLTLTAQQVTLGNIHTQVIGTSPSELSAPTVLTGTITADALQTESVSSRVAGRIEHLYVRQTGQLINRGAPLFSVYSEQLQSLQQEYLLALAQSREQGGAYRQFAEATSQKLRLLGLTSGQLRQLAARGRPNPVVTYYSPTTGTVQTLDVVQGQYVTEGSPLVTLTNLATVWVEAQLYPQDVDKLPIGKNVTVQVAGGPAPIKAKSSF